MSETTAYSCPQCGATLKLNPGADQLKCDFCGGSFAVEDIEAKVDETSQRKKAQEKVKKSEKNKPAFAFTNDELDSLPLERWEAMLSQGEIDQFEEVVGYTCKNCGAQVVTDKLTVATSCQYCGSSVVVDERLTGGLKPHYVIPFKVKAEAIPEMLTQFYEKRPLLPQDFFKNNQVGEVQGLYVPFWLYDGRVDGHATYKGSNVRSYQSGDYDVTETDVYASERAGYVAFDNVPVDASERIDDDLMDALEPFDFSQLKAFKAGYLTGFVAERFDQSPRQVFDRAGNRMKDTVQSMFLSSVTKYSARQTSGSFELSNPAASYVLLPVYLFNCKYRGKHFRYAINGQSGKIVGEVPVGLWKCVMTFCKGMIKGLGICLAVMVAFGVLGWILS